MERLNFNHLRAFWAVASEGGVAVGAARLGLTQPTISKQIGELEDALGTALFNRSGRSLQLSEAGRGVHACANEIFAIGEDVLEIARGESHGRQARLRVGVSDSVPKLLTRLVLEPVLGLDPPVRLICREGKTEGLFGDLALRALDVVITEEALPSGSRVRGFSHLLGTSDIGVFAHRELAGRLREGFPRSLHASPILMPTENTPVCRSVRAWLERQRLVPSVIADIEDSALLKSFAHAGHGACFAPMATRHEIEHQFGIELVGVIEDERVRESLYAITAERTIAHPGVVAIVESARNVLSTLMDSSSLSAPE
ncbi:MAG: LysR family transcriptional regulator [Phycisphaerales bacterium JB043]